MNGTPGRLSALLLLLLAACAPAPKRPSVVLILIDTLRPDHLELYGYEKATAPWIAGLGARGAVFPRAYSSSAWTPPSTASVFTGLYPTGHGLIHGFETDAWVKKQLEQGRALEIEVAHLPLELPTLPERFQRAGYATLGFTTNPHITQAFGFDRGFDVFHSESEQPVSSVVDAVLALRAELADGDRPYFLYLHLNDVHKPYHKHAPWYAPGSDERTEEIAQYDSGVSYVDSELQRLGAALGVEGEDAPIVCLISDHGEGFAEHGFYGHGSSLHAELNRVVMVYSGPGIDPGSVDANASLVDVAPTLLELAGLGFDNMDGISLLPLLQRERRAEESARLAERMLFAHRRGMTESALESALHPQELWSVLRGRWRLIDDGVTGELGLYDLEHDPLEQKNLYAEEADQRTRLTTLLSKFKERGIRPASGKARVLLDEKLFDDLQKLGYVDGGG